MMRQVMLLHKAKQLQLNHHLSNLRDVVDEEEEDMRIEEEEQLAMERTHSHPIIKMVNRQAVLARVGMQVGK